MSQKKASRGASPAQRKRRQRDKLRVAGKIKSEVWITSGTRTLLSAFAASKEMPLLRIAELILEAATPLYLREIQKRLTVLQPLMDRIALYERFHVAPLHIPGTPPIRIGSVTLDPYEHHLLRSKAEPLLGELGRYGVSAEMVWKMCKLPVTQQPVRQSL